MPSLPPPKKSGTSSAGAPRPRPTSHFRVQTASSTPVAAGIQTDETPNDAALRDTTALLDRFALTTLTRAAAATAPSTLGLKLALVERLASPCVTHPVTRTSDAEPVSRTNPAANAERTDLIRQALRVLDPSDWDDLIDERWADGLCAFAGCCTADNSAHSSTSASTNAGANAGKPREAYIPREDRTRRSQLRNVRLHGGSLVQRSHSASTASSNPDADSWSATPGGAYCSERCRAQSEYYRSLAGRGREPEREEMWDEMEQRRRRVKESTERLRQGGDDGGIDESDLNETSTAIPRISGAPVGASQAPTSSHGSSTAVSSSLLSRISIHEKPLRSDVKPAAPTLADADRDLEARQAQPRPSTSRTLNPSSGDPQRQPLSLPSASAAGTSIPAGQGAHGLPPIRFLTRPREVTSASTSKDGASRYHGGGEDDDDDFAHGPVLEGIGAEEVSWLEEALREREACERRAGAQ